MDDRNYIRLVRPVNYRRTMMIVVELRSYQMELIGNLDCRMRAAEDLDRNRLVVVDRNLMMAFVEHLEKYSLVIFHFWFLLSICHSPPKPPGPPGPPWPPNDEGPLAPAPARNFRKIIFNFTAINSHFFNSITVSALLWAAAARWSILTRWWWSCKKSSRFELFSAAKYEN